MSLCEIESRIMNYQKDESELAKLIYDETPKFRTVGDATAFILELKKSMSAMHIEIKQLKTFNQDLNNQVKTLEDLKTEHLEQILQWQHQFEYYQQLCVKFAKDLNLLEGPKYDANADLSPLQQQDLILRIK